MIVVVDAWGKVPSGILAGNMYELGNFDQCLSIEEAVENVGKIQGQYCLAGLIINVSNINEVSKAAMYSGHFTSELTKTLMQRLHLKQTSMIEYVTVF